MNNKKKLLLGLFGLALLVIACYFSWVYGFRQGLQVGGLTSSASELMRANDHMADQFANAKCEGVRQSINDYLKLVEKYSNKDNILFTETDALGDLMRGNLRLARIDKHEGNETERLKHLTIAKNACAQRKWADCSEEKLILFSKRTDQNHPIACLGND